jgi:hypothetical protein
MEYDSSPERGGFAHDRRLRAAIEEWIQGSRKLYAREPAELKRREEMAASIFEALDARKAGGK